MTAELLHKSENLRFFRQAIWEPALQGAEQGVISQFALLEAVYWAGLGLLVRYFDKGETIDLVSSASDSVHGALVRLRERNCISPTYEDWARNIDSFHELSGRDFNDEAPFDLLQHVFQTFLLLAAENLVDDDTRYFLDSIGWSEDSVWVDRSTGSDHHTDGKSYEFVYLLLPATGGAARSIALGFSNVLSYLQEIDATTVACAFPENRGVQPAVLALRNFVTFSMSARFNFEQIRVVERYFALAGAFVEVARDDTPGWYDSRQRIFRTLAALTSSRSRLTKSPIDYTRLWSVYTEASVKVPRSRARSRSQERGGEGNSGGISS